MEGSEDEEEVNYVQANDHQRDDQNDPQQQQYSFEEQFKQLYELSPDPKRKEFLDDLFLFMTRRGTPVNRIPIMAKQVLDLFELYRLVVTHGGLVEVINKKIWREITKGLNLPSSITSAAFTLRTQYMKYLYPYECDKEQLSTPDELQQAIDGNRRESRRSSHGNYPDMIGSPVAGGSGYSGNSLGGINGSTSNGGPSNGVLSNGVLSAHNMTPIHTASPLSLVARHLNAVNNNSGASSGEEDNGSIHSLSLNPLLALASAQAEALNLEVKPNANGHANGTNGIDNVISRNHNHSSSSLNSISFNNLEIDTSYVNGNGSNGRDSNNNNNNGRDRVESNKRINNNYLVNGHRKDPLHDTPGFDLTARPSSSSSSSTSTSASTSHNHGMKRNFSDDERLLINAGMPAAHIKISKSDGRGSLENSLLFSMEMNNMTYSGVLYPRSYKA